MDSLDHNKRSPGTGQRRGAVLVIENREQVVADAVDQIVANGVNPVALAIAVTSFGETAKEEGRFMGKGHEWLAVKRGWEAHLPSADAVFLDGRSGRDASDLRAYRRFQSLGDWQTYDFGPRPGEPGCRVAPDIIEHCDSNPTASATRAAKKGVGFV